MPSIDQQLAERDMKEMEDVPASSEDAELVTRMGVQLLQKGGLDVIKQALNESQDPAQVVGQFLTQLITQLAEQMASQGPFDPRVFLMKDGFLDHILDYIEDQLGLPEEFSDMVYDDVLNMIKAVAMDPPTAMEGGQPPQQGVAPQGGPSPEVAARASPGAPPIPQGGGF